MLTLTIMLLGSLTVFLSLFAAREFMKAAGSVDGSAKHVSSAISWQLWGESVIGLGTLIFATAAHFDWLSSWSLAVQSGLRLTMFIATSVTTAHLCFVVVKLKGLK